MVGFGSSLRMARRPGWEAAYLDYESLKLLLSQIEAVYEEEWHRKRNDDDVFGRDDAATPRRRNKRNKGEGDYRDELFLESDSDKAFASSASDRIEDHESLQSTDEENGTAKDGMSFSSHPGPPKPFTLSYSQEPSSSDLDDESVDMDSTCGAGSLTLGYWQSKSSPTRKNKKKHKRRIFDKPRDDSEFYVEGPNSFVTEGDASYTPFSRTMANERSGLLQQAQSSQAGTFFSFPARGESSTPPKDFSGGWAPPNPVTVAATNNVSGHGRRPTAAEIRREKYQAERRRKRRQRRRKKMLKEREDLERKVPRHLRIAHAKARSITERFLGFLRAEIEKVTLFAQSRLGELADAAGSLRFPSDADSEYGSFSSRPGPVYEHPLSDGGLHPSSSSSEDERPGGSRSMFPWSDSSDEDATSDSGRAETGQKKFSGESLSASTLRRVNRTRDENERDRVNTKGAKNIKAASRDAVKRKIDHFTDLRRARPTFQRNDDIVGEDLLLLSAVDETDGYTTVGVELMHVLRFICVNAIAVRKICRKHDRLLMNRMLGGYYHRKHPSRQPNPEPIPPQQLTLGSLVSRSLGEECRVDTFTNQYKLVGVFDDQVQELANSTTVQVISSSIALALSEYEVSQSRATALANFPKKTPKRSGAVREETHTVFPTVAQFALSPSTWIKQTNSGEASTPVRVKADTQTDSDEEGGPPSTASSVSLERLRFTVVSVFALREAARKKLNVYNSFLSRSLLAFVGPNIVGEGLDGCSRDVIDFFVSYDPDSALLREASEIYGGIHQGDWEQDPMGGVMLSALAVSINPPSPDFALGDDAVLNSVSIMPVSTSGADNLERSINDQVSSYFSHSRLKLGMEISSKMVDVNRLSVFLQAMNYYIVHSTANTFLVSVGARPAHSATIIGATSFGALIASVFHGYQLAKEPNGSHFTAGFYRASILLASLSSLIGNCVYITAVAINSVPLAVFGRLLIGIGSVDLLERQVVSRLPAPSVVPESARLVNAKVKGVVYGLLAGAFLSSFSMDFSLFGARLFTFGALQSASYIMAFCWLFQTYRITRFLFFGSLDDLQSVAQSKQSGRDKEEPTTARDDTTSSDDSDVAPSAPGRLLYNTSSDVTDSIRRGVSAEQARIPLNYFPSTSGAEKKLWKILLSRFRKFISYNVALPVTMALVVFVEATHEILFTSCAIITNRYFSWNGSHAGFFLGVMSAFVFLINFVCGSIANTYGERTVIKRSVLLVGGGFFIMINYASLFTLASNVPSLLDETTGRARSYDWVFGAYQYVIGFSVTFVGAIALDGTSLALMSKVAPTKVKSAVVNCGTIVTFSSLAARVIGDVHILMVGLSHRLINTDIVNSLVIPLLLACVAAGYIVRKHFFFLI